MVLHFRQRSFPLWSNIDWKTQLDSREKERPLESLSGHWSNSRCESSYARRDFSKQRIWQTRECGDNYQWKSNIWRVAVHVSQPQTIVVFSQLRFGWILGTAKRRCASLNYQRFTGEHQPLSLLYVSSKMRTSLRGFDNNVYKNVIPYRMEVMPIVDASQCTVWKMRTCRNC